MMNYNNIIVRNTKDLEKIDLSNMPNDTPIQVLGGMYGKPKYMKREHYKIRTTYTLGKLKQIIATMHEIESSINPNWPEITRARYIYEILGNNISYDYNSANYSNQQCSNLSILLSREGICAGYSLLFKEMMDRQGIECDYVRGKAYDYAGDQGKHAWNVLKIDGKNIPVDLTWDAPNIQKGKNLHYFGNDYQFTNNHILDYDEVQYQYDYLSSGELEKSDYKNYLQQKISNNRYIKKEVCKNALQKTYLKYSRLENPDIALERVQQAIYKYIMFGNANGFTRDEFARKNLEDNLSKEEYLDFIIEDYMQKCMNQEKVIPKDKSLKEQALSDAIIETIMTYSPEQAKVAVKKFISTGKTSMFTNQGNSKARTTLAYQVSNIEAIKFLIDDFVEKELFNQQGINQYVNTTDDMDNKVFSSKDFELVSFPKDRNIFMKAIEWIKEKVKDRKETHNNEVKQKKDNDYYER